MKASNIAQEIESLPPDAKKQVVDFLAFLRNRYPSASPKRRAPKTDLSNEPFIGMWKSRKEMKDSAEWVQNMRQKEWNRRS